jgi:DNA-binding NarL/FixJ family response regulator
LWARTYQFDGADTSILIDKLAGNIAIAVALSFDQFERERLKDVPEDQLDAWGLTARSMGLSVRTNQEAREWLRISRLAVQRDGDYAEAHANLANGILAILLASFDCDISDEDLKREALHHCDRAMILDEDSVYNLYRGSRVHRILGNRILALQLAERVNELTQGRSVSTLYQALIANGKSQQVVDHARAHTKEITNLAKGPAILTKGSAILATAQVIVGMNSEAEAELRGCISRSPSAYLLWMRLANVLALQGKNDEAREALAEAIRIGPTDWGVEAFLRRLRITWRSNPDILHPKTSGLRSLEEGQAPLDRLWDQAHDGASAPTNQLAKLSSRQKSVLKIALTGKLNKVIADELNIAEGTVKAHLSAVFKILGVKNRTEAVYLLSQRHAAPDFKRP